MSVLHLQYVQPDGERDIFHLKNSRRYRLGRGSSCELRILDMTMSRQHAAFEFVDDAWKLVDLGSTNGVSLNQIRVTEQASLKASDAIQAGSIKLSVIAINDHIDLAPEDLMELGAEAPVQDPMPSETEDVPIAKDDNPWEGELSFITDEDKAGVPEDAEQGAENHGRKPTVPAMPTMDKSPAIDINNAPAPAPAPKPLPAAKPGPIKPPEIVSKQPLSIEPPLTPKPVPMAQPKPGTTPAEAPEPPSPAPAITETSVNAEGKLMPSPAPMMQPKVPKPVVSPAKSEAPPRKPSDGKMVITLLDRRIGPIPRDAARELKKKQIMGTLTEAELDEYPQA